MKAIRTIIFSFVLLVICSDTSFTKSLQKKNLNDNDVENDHGNPLKNLNTQNNNDKKNIRSPLVDSINNGNRNTKHDNEERKLQALKIFGFTGDEFKNEFESLMKKDQASSSDDSTIVIDISDDSSTILLYEDKKNSSSGRGQTQTSSDSNNYATNKQMAMLESELSNPYVLYLDGTSPGEKDHTYLKFVQTLHPEVLQKYHRVSSWKRNLMSLRFTLEEESNNNVNAVSSSCVSMGGSSGNNNTRRPPSPDIQALLDAGDFSPLMNTQQHQKTFDVQDSSKTLKQSPREKRPTEKNNDNDDDDQDKEADFEEYNKKFYAKKLERWRKNLVKAKKQEEEDSSNFLSDEPLVDFFNDAKDQITQGFQRLSSQTNVFLGVSFVIHPVLLRMHVPALLTVLPAVVV
eukprot:CAMPEP_0178967706 /NCGR_PEP_ID=MMETSP0789-20121207/17776_1 /TAXON_ID=3005 /ORGANISM="Rhizosolenia setigera, Strain CCMP 1694" /LENGTH=402 /DNA_ID=CAMNT_0020653411 /DNA_START=45 /DNA_END=1254 /DNA_ORIENTATION=+